MPCHVDAARLRRNLTEGRAGVPLEDLRCRLKTRQSSAGYQDAVCDAMTAVLEIESPDYLFQAESIAIPSRIARSFFPRAKFTDSTKPTRPARCSRKAG